MRSYSLLLHLLFPTLYFCGLVPPASHTHLQNLSFIYLMPSCHAIQVPDKLKIVHVRTSVERSFSSFGIIGHRGSLLRFYASFALLLDRFIVADLSPLHSSFRMLCMRHDILNILSHFISQRSASAYIARK
jgi:hypothetical protein